MGRSAFALDCAVGAVYRKGVSERTSTADAARQVLEGLDVEALRTLAANVLAKRDALLKERAEERTAHDLRYRTLRAHYDRLLAEHELLKQRLFRAHAERVDTAQLELEFAELSRQLDQLAGQLAPDVPDETEVATEPEKPKSKNKPKGRRKPSDFSGLPEKKITINDPAMDALVAKGEAEVIGVESTSQLAFQRAGYIHLRTERLNYKVIRPSGDTVLSTAEVPKQLLSRSLATPSLLAHIATAKFADGLPLYRQEEIIARHGVTIDRGTMSRWLESLGGTLAASIVAAMEKDALANAFCILTDATGFAIQPGRSDDPKGKRKRRACRKGHYFVRIADQDHILFSYTRRHTSEAVQGLFKGYSGYIQADASSVYDVLFRPDKEEPERDLATRLGCWSHSRRKYWEAAFAKSEVAREALLRIHKIYKLDEKLRKDRPAPSKLKRLRDKHMRPLVEEFLTYAETEYAKVENQRGALRSALGYTRRQADELRAFLEDGRLRLDNNPSEGELRKIVRVRDAAFFAGSDEHAESAAGIMSLLASARLHGLDPEQYLRDVIRVLPHWPIDRMLELAPKYWRATRERLDPRQLEAELGPLDVPPPLDPSK